MKYDCIGPLTRLGIQYEDALSLRRISMTLHRWHELECGTDNGCVERDEESGKTYWISARGTRYPTVDRESGARKRLSRVMANYPGLIPYIQGDPRGASLYILRPEDVPEGKDVDAYYSRGVAVYK